MESQVKRYSFILLCLFCAAFSVAPANKHMVRVAVLTGEESFGLSIRGKYRIIDPVTGGVIDSGRRLKYSMVTTDQGDIEVGEAQYGIKRLRVIAQKDTSIYHNGKKKSYRNQIDIILTKKKEFLVINTLDLESYVKGVLYHEVPHRWPMNALKAQAVATRSYALYQTREMKDQEYDVSSNIYSQVYGGRSAERHRTNLAVHRTRGQILTFRDKLLPAYFHSNCGGHTEDAAELWKDDLPPLKGVSCGFCKGKPSYRWKKNFRSQDVQELLNANGYKLGLIKEIGVVDRTKSGRIRNLKITTRDGKSIIIPGIKFREIIGPNVLRSNFYDIEMEGYYFDVKGRGWGHGVGMCQWGAYQMAKERYDYLDILGFYYPGAVVSKVSEL